LIRRHTLNPAFLGEIIRKKSLGILQIGQLIFNADAMGLIPERKGSIGEPRLAGEWTEANSFRIRLGQHACH
jgi:hypothetical protein